MVGEGNGGGQDQGSGEQHVDDGTAEPLTQQSVGLTPEEAKAAQNLARQIEAASSAPGFVGDAVRKLANMPETPPTNEGVFEELTLPPVSGTEDRTVATYPTGPLVGGPEDPAATQPEMPAVRPGPASAQPDAPQPGNQGTSGSGPSGGTPGQS